MTYGLFKTRFGLSLRAVGEYPQAAGSAEISVALVRHAAVFLSGCLSQLGGAYLTPAHVQFTARRYSANASGPSPN